MNKSLVFFAALSLLFCGAAVVTFAYRMSQKQPPVAESKNVGSVPEYLAQPDVAPDELLTDFKLTERSGEKFDSQELDGSVHVASFFFASCPSTCRAQNEAIRRLHSDYGSKGVKFMSITCDPEADTPEKLKDYAQLFNAHPNQWLFLTGDLVYTRRIGAELYQMHVDKGVHMNRLALVDKWGDVRGQFKWQDEIEMKKMRTMMDELLVETASPNAPDETTDGDAESDEDNAAKDNVAEDNASAESASEGEVSASPEAAAKDAPQGDVNTGEEQAEEGSGNKDSAAEPSDGPGADEKATEGEAAKDEATATE